MYKVASDRRQSALHRGRLADWLGNEREYLTAEQHLKQLQEGVLILEKRILTLPKGEERSALGLQKLAMQNEIKELRQATHLVRQVKRGYAEVFITMAKEMLPKLQFDLLRGATDREWARQQKELEDTPVPEMPSLSPSSRSAP